MKTVYAHVGMALALASCAAPSQNPQELETVKRISIEYLHANTESLLGETVELRGYVRAGFDGYDFSCDVGKSKHSFKLNTRVFLNAPICVIPDKLEYKEGMATVRGVVFSRESGESGEFLIFNRIYSRELKNVSIKWDK